jgi:hypothetical protein
LEPIVLALARVHSVILQLKPLVRGDVHRNYLFVALLKLLKRFIAPSPRATSIPNGQNSKNDRSQDGA